jgi:O-antigen/teichoic acid export membrane protein
MGRSKNKQLFYNLFTNGLSFVLTLGVSFFLTPYIVGKLGTAAYGFIGLTNNIIGYTLLVTVVLNSMAGRFITLKYHEHDFEESNRYLSSTFYANTTFAVFILGLTSVFLCFMEDLLDVPGDLLLDVKILFAMLSLNAAFGLSTGTLGISTFIKNRIDMSSIRSMIGTIIRTVLLVGLFVLFQPKLWYFGITAMVMSAYVFSTNVHFFKTLTPELQINYKYFDFKHIVELVKAGAWNLISSLSDLLNRGLDLLMANVFIGATAMGTLSITNTVPALILSFFATQSGSFNPQYMKLYAAKDFDGLKAELLKAIRLFSMFTAIPVAILFAYGDLFYANWLPTEDATLLYYLTVAGSLGLIFSLPSEPLWYIFTMTNKVKISSLNLLMFASISFILVLLGVSLCDDNQQRLFILVGIRGIIGPIRSLTFLPLFGAKVLNFPKITFYKPIVRNVVSVIILTSISFFIKSFIAKPTWGSFIGASAITASLGLVIGYFIVLKQSDREFLINRLRMKLHIA